MIELLFIAQNHHMPWHEPYVGQLVTCKPDPKQEDKMIGEYTFDGSTLQMFTFKKSPKGCPLRVTVEPHPQPEKKS